MSELPAELAGTRLRDAITAALGEAFIVWQEKRATISDPPFAAQLADALLPLVVAEVRSAAEVAWDEAWQASIDTATDARGDYIRPPANPYRKCGISEPHLCWDRANPYRVEEAPPAVIAAHVGWYCASWDDACCEDAPCPHCQREMDEWARQRSAGRVDEPATPPARPSEFEKDLRRTMGMFTRNPLSAGEGSSS